MGSWKGTNLCKNVFEQKFILYLDAIKSERRRGPFYRSVRTHTARGVLLFVCMLTYQQCMHMRDREKEAKEPRPFHWGNKFLRSPDNKLHEDFLQSLKASAYLKYWFCITFNTRNSQLCHFCGRRDRPPPPPQQQPHPSSFPARTPLICRSAPRSTFKCLSALSGNWAWNLWWYAFSLGGALAILLAKAQV